MASENRILTANPNQEITSSWLNDLQDNFAFSWQMDGSTLAPTATWYGMTLYYGQYTFTNAGTKVTILDSSRDWRNRILLTKLVMVTAANELPRASAAYDPNLGGGAWDWNLWSTEAGDTGAGVPAAGTFWQSPANQYVFASNAAAGGAAIGDLCVYNNTGADTYGFLMVIQSPDIS